MIRLAPTSSPAPIRCAICTLKPVLNAEVRPPKSHVLDATSPMDADASAPSLPTMDASMYSITIEDICAKIAGTLK